jgi:hypothetical protein
MCHNLSTRARRKRAATTAFGLPSAYTSTIATKLAARASGRFRQDFPCHTYVTPCLQIQHLQIGKAKRVATLTKRYRHVMYSIVAWGSSGTRLGLIAMSRPMSKLNLQHTHASASSEREGLSRKRAMRR